MKICYFTLTNNIPPRDIVYLDGLKENGVEIIECKDHSPSWRKFLTLYKKHKLIKNDYDILMVGYTAHILVPFARLISRKKIVFNALSSLYEGIVVSRQQSSPLSFRGIYCWLVDFFAFHLAHLSLLESQNQVSYVAKKFFVPRRKLLKSWTGVSNQDFFYDPALPKLKDFTILFRGGFLPESGIQYAVEASKILQKENIKFRIIGTGLMSHQVEKMLNSFDSKNMEWIKDRLPDTELRKKMQECHLSLGQLSNHPRLNRTIPHKAFESAAMKIPYLTARNKAVLELFKDNETCFGCNPADAQDLADKILWIKNNYETAQKVAENAYQLYLHKLIPKILAKNMLDYIRTIQ